MASVKTNINGIRAKWDGLAVPQLRAEIERLTDLLQVSERRNSYLEDVADSWREDALRAIEESGAQPGLTIDGRLVAIHTVSAA